MPVAELVRSVYPPDFSKNLRVYIAPRPDVLETTTEGMKRQFDRETLAGEVSYIDSHLVQEGLEEGWEKLSGTGFSTENQITFLHSALADTTYSPQERLRNWLVGTEAELKGFVREYLEKKDNGDENLSFPVSYAIKERGGRMRMINTFHGSSKLLEQTVSKTERNGAVWDVLVHKIEPFFLDAPDGSIAYFISKDGLSGMKDDKGNELIFPHSFTYAMQKRGDEVVGIGIKNDFSAKEHNAFIKRMTGESLSEDASDEEYVRAVGMYRSDEVDKHGIATLEDVVNNMRDARFDVSGGKLSVYKKQMWNQVYKDISRMDDLWEIDNESQQKIKEFLDFAESGQWDDPTLQKAMALTILRVKRIQEARFITSQGVVWPQATKLYGDDVRAIQAAAGCAGVAVESITDRFAVRSGDVVKSGFCRGCGAIAECGICEGCHQKELSEGKTE